MVRGLPEMEHWTAVTICSWAAVGDGLLAVFAFWVVAGLRARTWMERPERASVAVFTLTGLTVTVAAEWLATEVWHWWSYAPHMITVPVLGIGLTPALQWILLPPLVVGIVHRQLSGRS